MEIGRFIQFSPFFRFELFPNGSDEMLCFITDREEDNDSPEDMVLEIDSDEDEANGILVGRNLQGICCIL